MSWPSRLQAREKYNCRIYGQNWSTGVAHYGGHCEDWNFDTNDERSDMLDSNNTGYKCDPHFYF